MTQLNVPMGFRLMALRLRRLDLANALPWYDIALKTGLVVLFGGIVYLAALTYVGAIKSVGYNPFAEVSQSTLGAWTLWGVVWYTKLMIVVTLIRVVLALRYRPMASLSDAELPFVTVIIPAYNEGPDVAKSIESIARSNYPKHKLQIIAVNDGSKDDTWTYMDRMAKRYPDNVCAINMEKNGGKRQGLRVGFALAAGDVIVTMDSDSVVEVNSLRNLVTPIVVDTRIGAVAGNVKVMNRRAGIIPRMLGASFIHSFDFTRAYQSVIRTVQCTPGAFSAYRRTACEDVLHQWNNQTFMGKPSTIAEDRALSNLLLKDGHEVVFQGNAVVYTNVPTAYKGLAKMFMRWERGNARENLTYASFCLTKFRDRFWWAANVDFVLGCLDMIVPYLLIAASLVYSLFNPFFGLKYLASVIVFSTIMQLYYIHREKDTDFIYGILYNVFYFTALWWVVPYSIATAGNGSWMTRQLPASTVPTNEVPAVKETATWQPERLAA